jgi:hypothetical protein
MFVKELAIGIGVGVFCIMGAPPAGTAKHARSGDTDSGSKTIVLWRDPVDITSRDLFYGPGGKAHVPHGKFVFVKEDLDGTNPKFVVRDQSGTKWKVKMGNEARPETAASRIAWAVGFYTNEDYYLADLHIEGMPARLRRGQKLVAPGGYVYGVRMKREDEKKVSNWEWRRSPFTGTKELNGLRVVMAVMNNWDLKDANNAVYREGSEYVYAVSDLGATFGTAGRSWPKDKSKGDLDSYQRSKFIGKVTDTTVSFRIPARPSFVFLVNPKEYFQRIHMESIGHDVPRQDVKWMGRLLIRLSPSQIRDAFRAAGYSPADVTAFAGIVEKRIQILTDL